MIAGLLRRALCRVGSHHVVRCAGADDHRWTWSESRRGWVAELVPPEPRPAPVATPPAAAAPRSTAPRHRSPR